MKAAGQTETNMAENNLSGRVAFGAVKEQPADQSREGCAMQFEQSNMVNVDLRHVIMMIARALDYVGIDDFNHGHRVGYIAYECAKSLGWAENRQEFIFLAGLLHDCGVSSTSEHMRLLSGLEPEQAEGHCVRGYEYLNNCVVLRPFSAIARYHHTRWDELVTLDIDPVDRDTAALICLADRVDFLRSRYIDETHPDSVILHGQRISECVMAQSGKLFNPEYAEVLSNLSHIEGFWFNMDQAFIEDMGLSMGGGSSYDMPLNIAEVTNLATFMSRVVDAKSPFTHEHSERVALISKELASDLDLTTWEQQQIFVSGLLHDLGKLRVPEEILQKNAR
jgi:HD-GYP domain-containing protein (c-di-GMP phosphodiesterase class II)